jgi:hypothetical protein
VGELKAPGKSFEISKWAVWEAWEKVKANKGAPGVDGQSVAEFEKDLKGNLYKIWNRMSSGSYFRVIHRSNAQVRALRGHAVVHCVSEAQAHRVLAALVERMREVGL